MKNERNAGRKPSKEGRGKQVSFYLNPKQERAVKAYVANLRVDNDLLDKLQGAVWKWLAGETLRCIDAPYMTRPDKDEVQGIDLDNYYKDDVQAEWETQQDNLVNQLCDATGSKTKLYDILEKIVRGVDYD